jgi:hypothetical protein
VKEGATSRDQLAVFFGEPGLEGGDLYTFRWDSGRRDLEIDLDPSIMKAGVLYNYAVGFNMRGDAEAKSQAGVDRFKVVTDLQVSPHSLPALRLGKNQVRFWTDGAPGKVRITHRWREVHDRLPPGKVASGDGVASTLKWSAAERAADYQLMISRDPQCRWPHSPTLWQNVGSATTKWAVPQGFLNSGETYYWKVRARSQTGDIGPWSDIFKLQP